MNCYESFPLSNKTFCLVNASAIGIYPASDDNIYTEESMDYANDFLGQTVTDWEKKAASVELKVYGLFS